MKVSYGSMPHLTNESFLTKEQQDRLKGTFDDFVAVVRCKDCLFGESCKNGRGEHGVMCYNSQSANKDWVHEPDWFCADGGRR